MLKQVKINKATFIQILTDFDLYTEKVDNLFDWNKGYKNKQIIYYTETQLICTESHLNFINVLDKMDTDDMYTPWKQVICELDVNQEEKIKSDITGTIATAICLKQLYKKYEKQEVVDILKSYDTFTGASQLHSSDPNADDFSTSQFGLFKYNNCIGYDINGAHNYYLTKIFDRCDYFQYAFDHRKEEPNYKKIVNYFVGDIKRRGYVGAYRWIVDQTTQQLDKMISETRDFEKSRMIYVNTDGFIIQHPSAKLNISDKLGEVKKEMEGTVYYYKDKNYYLYQYIDSKGKVVKKGNMLMELRDQVDLFEGKVVHYKRVKNKYGLYVAEDVTSEYINLTREY